MRIDQEVSDTDMPDAQATTHTTAMGSEDTKGPSDPQSASHERRHRLPSPPSNKGKSPEQRTKRLKIHSQGDDSVLTPDDIPDTQAFTALASQNGSIATSTDTLDASDCADAEMPDADVPTEDDMASDTGELRIGLFQMKIKAEDNTSTCSQVDMAGGIQADPGACCSGQDVSLETAWSHKVIFRVERHVSSACAALIAREFGEAAPSAMNRTVDQCADPPGIDTLLADWEMRPTGEGLLSYEEAHNEDDPPTGDDPLSHYESFGGTLFMDRSQITVQDTHANSDTTAEDPELFKGVLPQLGQFTPDPAAVYDSHIGQNHLYLPLTTTTDHIIVSAPGSKARQGDGSTHSDSLLTVTQSAKDTGEAYAKAGRKPWDFAKNRKVETSKRTSLPLDHMPELTLVEPSAPTSATKAESTPAKSKKQATRQVTEDSTPASATEAESEPAKSKKQATHQVTEDSTPTSATEAESEPAKSEEQATHEVTGKEYESILGIGRQDSRDQISPSPFRRYKDMSEDGPVLWTDRQNVGYVPGHEQVESFTIDDITLRPIRVNELGLRGG